MPEAVAAPSQTTPPAGTNSPPPALAPTPILGTPPAAAAQPTPTTPTDNAGAGAPPNGTPTPAPDLKVTLPEGVDKETAGLIEKAKPLLKEAGLTSEKAQKLVDLVLESNKATQAAFRTSQEQAFKQWEKSLSEDKDIGGSAFEASKVAAQKAVAKFGAGDAELSAFLNSPMGSFPPLVRLMVRVGRSLAEAGAGPTGGQPVTKKQDLNATLSTASNEDLGQLYPSMQKAG